MNSEQPFRTVMPWIMFTAVMFLLVYLDRSLFGPLLPALEKEFALTHVQSTRYLLFISIGYSLSVFSSAFTGAWVKARHLAGGAVVAAGLTLAAITFAKSTIVLSLLFGLLGISAGQYFNGGMSTMQSLVSPRQWATAISIHEVGPSISFVFSPLLAQLALTLPGGWRSMVLTISALSIVIGLLYMFFNKGGNERSEKVSFSGFMEVLKDPRLWLFSWFLGLAIGGEFGPFSVMLMHLTENRGIMTEQAASLLAMSRMGAPVAVLFGGWLTYRFGVLRFLVFCFCLFALGMFFMASPWYNLMLVGLFIHPIAAALSFPPIFSIPAEVFDLKSQPLVLALAVPASSMIGAGIMPFLLGVCGDYLSFTTGFMGIGIILILTIPLVQFAKKTRSSI